MKKIPQLLKLISLVALCLLTSCLPPEPFTTSKNDLVVERRIVGSWIGDSYLAEIKLINSDDYSVTLEQHSKFIEQSMDFNIEAVGNLYRYENLLVGQFKTSSFKIGSKSRAQEPQEMLELKDHYVIGVFEELDDKSFVFCWLPYEAFGKNRPMTTKMLREKLSELIKSGEYKKGAMPFTKLTKDFTAEQYHAREREKIQERQKHCLDIVKGQIPVESIINKYVIPEEELSCLEGAIGQQKKLDKDTLSKLFELNLSVRGVVNILRHENSTDEMKKRAVHKILFSDRKNFEGGNPLAEKRDKSNKIIAYHPFVTGELLQENVLLLESNPEWFDNKEFVDFVFNISRIGITPPESLDVIVDKINEVLTMYVDGKKSLFTSQPYMNYLLRDIYFHENITKKTRAKMLNFYSGDLAGCKNKRLISTLTGRLINEILSAYWVSNNDCLELINFVIEQNKNGAGIGNANGVTYYTGRPDDGINYERTIGKNILSQETLVDLAKLNPGTIRYSLEKINDKKYLLDVKSSLEQEISSLQMKVDDASKLSTGQKSDLYWIREAIKSYSGLLAQLEKKISTS